MCTTLVDMGYSNAEIRVFMNWKTDRMVDYYTNTRRQMSATAPATAWRDDKRVADSQKALI